VWIVEKNECERKQQKQGVCLALTEQEEVFPGETYGTSWSSYSVDVISGFVLRFLPIIKNRENLQFLQIRRITK